MAGAVVSPVNPIMPSNSLQILDPPVKLVISHFGKRFVGLGQGAIVLNIVLHVKAKYHIGPMNFPRKPHGDRD